MSDIDNFDQEDLPLYAMQLLPRDEAARFGDALDLSPELRGELAETLGDLAIYATAVEMHSPPALAREHLLAQIGREPKPQPEPEPRPELFPGAAAASAAAHPASAAELRYSPTAADRLTEDDLPGHLPGLARFLPWIGWAVAAALAVTTGNFYHEGEALRDTLAHDHAQLSRVTAESSLANQLMDMLRNPAATEVTLTSSRQTPSPQGKVTYLADKGSLLFVASNLDPLQAYKVYELWLIPANGQQLPVPAGTFHPDAHGNASVILPPLPAGLKAKAFGITIEDEGGSQIPTMPILLAGAAPAS